MLALLLARRGVPVTLLEAHATFDRDFRGDTFHPAILQILDEIGLADLLHQRQHVKMYGPTAQGPVMPSSSRGRGSLPKKIGNGRKKTTADRIGAVTVLASPCPQAR